MANIKTVGVIGAGQMGNGIAHVAALALTFFLTTCRRTASGRRWRRSTAT
jgi:3-hydroxyacyl-CoA dehydrogenase